MNFTLLYEFLFILFVASQGTGLILEWRHSADVGWISEFRRSGDAWVLPRVVLEAFPTELLTRSKQRDKAIKLIVTECKIWDMMVLC
ncbi:hypothetical protein CMV_018932 [Castanea mollissima]|uniref:Secreted protein n=1 Tax=Castanea mollissima TaxID=60419 RepID=A0A8J4QNV3_9ROSI|nr:hypothetical protein CMV_018932 [Castanea mollissima]